MRGEDPLGGSDGSLGCGSPPHARGRLYAALLAAGTLRITPACAGKTGWCPHTRRRPTDHPRMRGEDGQGGQDPLGLLGSPPHARGRPPFRPAASPAARITPACAGKTPSRQAAFSLRWDHPRMRGEDLQDKIAYTFNHGSPPHARGRRVAVPDSEGAARITPACAGKTRSPFSRLSSGRDHPRMRGEDASSSSSSSGVNGSPPHARGRRPGGVDACGSHGITPACAGKTSGM